MASARDISTVTTRTTVLLIFASCVVEPGEYPDCPANTTPFAPYVTSERTEQDTGLKADRTQRHLCVPAEGYIMPVMGGVFGLGV